jgi:tripartite-type tricarboxylate transporter receptor subunit TctC
LPRRIPTNANLGDALPLIKAGKLKAVAVASKERFPALSDVPTIDEALPGFVSDTWYALVAPPKTPPAIAMQLSAAISEALATPELKSRLADMSAVPVGSSPDVSAAYIKRESARWGDVIVAAGIKLEG